MPGAIENEGGSEKTEPKETAPSMIGATSKTKDEPKPKVEAAPAKVEPAPAKVEDLAQLGEDDDEIPENAKLFKLSTAALNARLARHSKKELREHFGSDDPAQIKADLAELKTLREEKEAARLASLSEMEKLKEERDTEKKRADEAEKKHQKAIDSQVFSEYDREAASIVGTHVAEKHVKRAVRELKEHVLSLDDDDLEKPTKVFEAWTKDFVKENPEFAREGAPEPKKIALTTGSDPNAKREKGNMDAATKIPQPGQANSMSKGEYAAFKRQRGLS